MHTHRQLINENMFNNNKNGIIIFPYENINAFHFLLLMTWSLSCPTVVLWTATQRPGVLFPSFSRDSKWGCHL